MKVQCRVVCKRKVENEPYPGLKNPSKQARFEVSFEPALDDPVYGEATPSGKIDLRVIESAAENFKPGKKYLMIFEEDDPDPDTPKEGTSPSTASQE